MGQTWGQLWGAWKSKVCAWLSLLRLASLPALPTPAALPNPSRELSRVRSRLLGADSGVPASPAWCRCGDERQNSVLGSPAKHQSCDAEGSCVGPAAGDRELQWQSLLAVQES